MVLTIFIGILFLAIVFFHYLQGLFSATVSAVLSIIAAVLAFSWHETIVEKFLQGKAANIAHAMVIVALYAVFYLVLRIIFDKAIPEGVTLPALLDKIGGAVMGAVSAVFCLGILAVAVQEMPFGASAAGYVKYATADIDAQVITSTSSQRQSGFNFDELHSDLAGKFDEADRKQLFPLIPAGVDEILVNTVYHLSSTGSLSGNQPLADVHPDFLQELFGQRIGIQGGAQHVTMNLPGAAEAAIKIEGEFLLQPETVRLADGNGDQVRTKPVTEPLKIVDTKKPVIGESGGQKQTETVVIAEPSSPKQVLLVVRISFGMDATDKRDMVRISPGAIRLVANHMGSSGSPEPVNYYPIGTLEPGSPLPTLYADKPDDFLLVPLIRAADKRTAMDAVFMVDKDTFLTKDHKKIEDGAFIEVKRMFREELGGKSLVAWPGNTDKVEIGTLHQKRLHTIVTGDTASYPPESKQ